MNRAFLALVAAFVHAQPQFAHAQHSPDRVRELAELLAPPGAVAVCQAERSTHADEGPTRSCRWTVSASPRADTMVLLQYGRDSASLQLDHQFADRAAAARLLDSFVGIGRRFDLAMRECGVVNTPAGDARGRLWFSQHLIVHVTEFETASALPRILIVATNVPNAFPTDLMCPGDAFGHGGTR